MERISNAWPASLPPTLAPLLLLWLLLAAQATGAAREGDYCSLCEVPGSHTMCIYPSPGPDLNCTSYRPAPLSAREKRAIVRTHNLVRRRVATGRAWARASGFGPQPPAADMRQLEWDEELAMLAQRWADRCLPFYTTSPHDACRDLRRYPVGQNIVSTAYSTPAASDVRARTLDWYGELAFFDPALVRRFNPVFDPDPKKQIGHYAQMVWGWTYAIGCARVVFHDVLPGEQGVWVVERLVCNYAPSGNYLGQPVYTVGAPCSRCPRGTVCSERYPGLCTAPSPLVDSGGGGASSGAGDTLQVLLPTPDAATAAATEHASDEDVVLDGVRALENGTRAPETYKVAYETEEPGDAQSSQGTAEDYEDDRSNGSQAGEDGKDGGGEGSEEGEDSEGNKGGKDEGREGSEGIKDESGEDSENGEGNDGGEGNKGREDGKDEGSEGSDVGKNEGGEGSEDSDDESGEGSENEKDNEGGEESDDGEGEISQDSRSSKGNRTDSVSESNDGGEDAGDESGEGYESNDSTDNSEDDESSVGDDGSERQVSGDNRGSESVGDGEGSVKDEGNEDNTFRSAWLFPSAESIEKPRSTGQYFYFYDVDRSSL